MSILGEHMPSEHPKVSRSVSIPFPSFRMLTLFQSRESIGINGSLHQSGLAKSMPPCYQRGILDDPQPRASDWAEGFQNGGPRMKERSFPFLLLRPSIKIPPWDEKFILPPDRWYFAWLDAGSLRDRWYHHLSTTHPPSMKGIDDGHEVARQFRQRLQAARAAHRESQKSRVTSNMDDRQRRQDQNGLDTRPDAQGQSDVDNGFQGAVRS